VGDVVALGVERILSSPGVEPRLLHLREWGAGGRISGEVGVERREACAEVVLEVVRVQIGLQGTWAISGLHE